jgi:hypothetical protein
MGVSLTAIALKFMVVFGPVYYDRRNKTFGRLSGTFQFAIKFFAGHVFSKPQPAGDAVVGLTIMW